MVRTRTFYTYGVIGLMMAMLTLALAPIAQAQKTPRMTKTIAIKVANKESLHPDGDGDSTWADGSYGLQNLTLWRLSSNTSTGLWWNGKKASSIDEADDWIWNRTHPETGIRIMHVNQVWHKFRWRFSGHCIALDRIAIRCPARFDFRWLKNDAWTQYHDHRPPGYRTYGFFVVRWNEITDNDPAPWLPHTTVAGKTYVAMIDWSASNPPYIHEGSGTWLPRPEGNWWNWDGSGWGLMGGPGGDHIQSGGDIAPTEWWTGEWRVPYTLTKREWPYSIMDFDTEHYYNCTSLRRSTCKMVW